MDNTLAKHTPKDVIEAKLRAIENACQSSKDHGGEIDPEELLIHVDELRTHLHEIGVLGNSDSDSESTEKSNEIITFANKLV